MNIRCLRVPDLQLEVNAVIMMPTLSKEYTVYGRITDRLRVVATSTIVLTEDEIYIIHQNA